MLVDRVFPVYFGECQKHLKPSLGEVFNVSDMSQNKPENPKLLAW